MIAAGLYDHAVLIKMGARRVSDTASGVDITPDIDITGYAAVKQSHDSRVAIQAEIAKLEAEQTPRRVREALTGSDSGWLKAHDEQIAALRAQLLK